MKRPYLRTLPHGAENRRRSARHLLACALVIASAPFACDAAATDAGADPVVTALLNTAINVNAPTSSRLSAMDILGRLGGSRLGKHEADVSVGLAKLLHQPPTRESRDTDLFRWRVLETLSRLGPAAAPALNDIAALKSVDPTLLAAKEEALKAITKVPDAKAEKPPSPPTAVAAVETISGIRTDLRSNSAAVQLAALKNLLLLKSDPDNFLREISQLMSNAGDVDVRRLAAEAAKHFIEMLPAKSPDDDNAKREYVEGLISMLNGNGHETQERLFALAALAEVAKQQAEFGVTALTATGAIYQAVKDADPLVQALAKAIPLDAKTKTAEAQQSQSE